MKKLCMIIPLVFLFCFTFGCKKGEEVRLLADGVTELSGKLPVNPSGGLLSKGHPLSATGVAQIVELTLQLRGQAGGCQIDRPKVGMAHTQGGEVVDLEAGAVGVHILKR